MSLLSKAELMALGPKTIDVPLPELGEGKMLRVREMNGLVLLDTVSKTRALPAAADGEPLPPAHLELMYQVLEQTVVDADGNLMFNAGEIAQVWLPQAAILRLWRAAWGLSGLDSAAQEEQAKNLEATPANNSLAA